MCGLFGVVGDIPLNKEKALSSLKLLEHRGPDQHNNWSSKKVFMGHQRLSILDLSEDGRQPMLDSGVVISVNGEIYNFTELKEILSQKYTFKSNSDSEVVLYGYIEWGIDELLKKIDGMYAICIYDQNIDKLYIVRDRVGIKPLFYSLLNHEFSWSSELKCIRNYYGEANLEHDKTALYDFLTYLYIPAPKTMYQGVFKLEPAHYAEYCLKTSKMNLIQYWQLKTDVVNISAQDAKAKLNNLISKSVSEQLISDVPVGFFLSGGMDSSAVVATASKLTNNVHTYSIGFDDKAHDETKFAEIVANKFNTTHQKKILDRDTTKNMFHKLKDWYDEPFGDTSAFPTYLVSKFAKAESTVVLTGDGGDEVFGGYNWYRNFVRFRKYSLHKGVNWLLPISFKIKNTLPDGIVKKVIDRAQLEFMLTDFELYTKLMGGLLAEEKTKYAKLWDIPAEYDDYWYFKKHYKTDLPVLTRLQYLDFHTYLPDDILTKVDRVSMDVSLECRVPLLSKDIIEFSFSLPEDIRYLDGQLKGILKESFREVLPDEIIDRDKKGFSIPSASWKKTIYKKELNRQENLLKVFVDL